MSWTSIYDTIYNTTQQNKNMTVQIYIQLHQKCVMPVDCSENNTYFRTINRASQPLQIFMKIHVSNKHNQHIYTLYQHH